MRLLILSAANSIHTVRWANSMFERGNEVMVVSCKDHKEGVNKFANGVKIVYLKHNAGIGYYLNAKEIRGIINRFMPQVINVHYASGYGTLARISGIKKYILNIWGSDVYDFPNESWLKRIILKRNLKSATIIASTSKCMAEEARKYTNKQIYITPFGVNIELFHPILKKNENNTFRFCTIKTLAPKYGIIGIIEAFKLLLDKEMAGNYDKNIVYEIYGEGPQKEEILELIAKLGLEQHVFLKGYIPNNRVPDIINERDVFLLNSQLDSDSFGVAAVEVMACKKPIIVSDVAGFKEVVVDNESGLIVKRDDIQAYANAMQKLLLDEGLRDSISAKAYERARAMFNWEDNVDSMLKIYNRLIDNKEK